MKKITSAFFAALLFGAFAFSASAADEAMPVTVNAKLEKILQTQKDIQRQLDEIKAELAIVKVRATQNT